MRPSHGTCSWTTRFEPSLEKNSYAAWSDFRPNGRPAGPINRAEPSSHPAAARACAHHFIDADQGALAPTVHDP
jgi:hypothetical protein